MQCRSHISTPFLPQWHLRARVHFRRSGVAGSVHASPGESSLRLTLSTTPRHTLATHQTTTSLHAMLAECLRHTTPTLPPAPTCPKAKSLSPCLHPAPPAPPRPPTCTLIYDLTEHYQPPSTAGRCSGLLLRRRLLPSHHGACVPGDGAGQPPVRELEVDVHLEAVQGGIHAVQRGAGHDLERLQPRTKPSSPSTTRERHTQRSSPPGETR